MISRPSLKGWGVCLSLLLALPARASEPPSIIVEGRTMTREAVSAQARTLVNRFMARNLHDQFGRWNMPVCPVVLGVAPEIAQVVTDKLRAVAADVGAKVGKSGCDSNILIAFTDNARAVYRKVAARNASMFARNDVGPTEHKALSESDLPVRWWYSQQIADVSGIAAVNGAELPGAAGRVPFNEYGSGSTALYNGGSLIKSAVRVDLRSAAVLVDVNLATGVKLDALAAYVALVTLSVARVPSPPVDFPSIANLFVPGRDREDDLTAWDRAFLKALYKMPPDRHRIAQRGAITRVMTNILVGSEGSGGESPR